MEYTTIGESCSVVSGGTPSRSKTEYWRNGTIPWIKIGNIKSKYVNEYDELITEQGLNNSSAKLLKKGTILYTIFATLGEVGILDTEACTNQAIAGININDPRITTDYLYYYLKSKKDYVNNIGRGVAQNNINLTALKKFEIPLINVDKQLYIVEVLEKVERMIGLKKKEIDDLDLLIKARFVEMFGDPGSNEKEWKMNTFRDICTVRQGLQIPISDRLKHYEDDCYEYITVQYLHGGKDREYIKNPKSSVICTKNDILMTRTGNTGMVITGVEGVFHNNFFLIDFDRSRYDKDFLMQYLKLDIIQADILRRAGTSTIPDLNHGEFYKINVFLPPIELQEQFSVFVQQVDKSKFRDFISHKHDKYHQYKLVVLLLYIFILSYLM